MESLTYSLIKLGIKLRFKKPVIYGEENIDKVNPGIYMSNHERYYGPMIVTTRFPVPVRQWAISLIVNLEEAKKYVQETLFEETLGMKKNISKILGSLAAHPISWTIRQANPIPAYSDPKMTRHSIQHGLDAISSGENQFIYAPHCCPDDETFQFMQGFILLVKSAYSKLGALPNIYPVAINREKSTIAVGRPTVFNPGTAFRAESERLNAYLIDNIRLGYNNPEKMVMV